MGWVVSKERKSLKKNIDFRNYKIKDKDEEDGYYQKENYWILKLFSFGITTTFYDRKISFHKMKVFCCCAMLHMLF